ncbi:hypothetical protein AB0C29_23110 [Actinoplanes sp. NPDC048791]|uniref:hypothetical protein n=1 Tax=Actinoplanes sp. NPDC048791 TaxID=3154623 RepID=UPI00341094A7
MHPLTTLEPDDLSGWWIWYALLQVWRLVTFLGEAAPWLAGAVVVALAGLVVLLRFGARRRAAARAEAADQPTGDREGLADVGF